MGETSIAGTWRRYPQRYRLVGTRCKTCGNYYFPPRTICPVCRRKGKLEEYQFSGKGTIESFTIVHVPPENLEGTSPYILALVKLEEGPLITSQIVDIDPKDVRIGMPVKLVFRKIHEDSNDGLINYGYKFTPDTES